MKMKGVFIYKLINMIGMEDTRSNVRVKHGLLIARNIVRKEGNIYMEDCMNTIGDFMLIQLLSNNQPLGGIDDAMGIGYIQNLVYMLINHTW